MGPPRLREGERGGGGERERGGGEERDSPCSRALTLLNVYYIQHITDSKFVFLSRGN